MFVSAIIIYFVFQKEFDENYIKNQYQKILNEIPFDFALIPISGGNAEIYTESRNLIPGSTAGEYWQRDGEKKYLSCSGNKLYFYDFNRKSLNSLTISDLDNCRRIRQFNYEEGKYLLGGDNYNRYDYVADLRNESVEANVVWDSSLPMREDAFNGLTKTKCNLLTDECLVTDSFWLRNSDLVEGELAQKINNLGIDHKSLVAMKDGFLFFWNDSPGVMSDFQFGFFPVAEAGLQKMYLNVYKVKDKEVIVFPEPFITGVGYPYYVVFL